MGHITTIPIACSLTDAQRQQRRTEVMHHIIGQVQENRQLANGYAFRLSANDTTLELLMQMINLERVCCPFLRFQLTVEPGNGPIWLELTGPDGTKDFLAAELGL